MAEYTQGPWVVKGEVGKMLCVTDHDAAYIVDRFLLGGRSPEEHLANARLIAVAPDLLVAATESLAAFQRLKAKWYLLTEDQYDEFPGAAVMRTLATVIARTVKG
jgi:hypothetical protein